MKSKVKDFSKKATGHHKVWGKFANKKKNVKPKSINQNTVTPMETGNRADMDLGKLMSK